MKKKILILTLILTLLGTGVLGLTLITLTPDEAYEAAAENNVQFEINDLNLQLKQITHEKNEKTASLPALNNYNGQITKYYNPFNSETSLVVKEADNERAKKLLEIDIMSAAVALENFTLAYNDSQLNYDEAKIEYTDAKKDSLVSDAELMQIIYTRDSASVALAKSELDLISAQKKLDNLIGKTGTAVVLPSEYSDPYDIVFENVYESALETDISIYQSSRNAEAALIKFEIAERFFDEDEDTYISALVGLKSAELSYDNSLLSLQMNIYDDIGNLKNKYDSIALAELNKTIKSNAYTAAKAQLEAGIVSASSLESSKDSYMSSISQLNAKIHDYILSSMRFTLDYGYDY